MTAKRLSQKEREAVLRAAEAIDSGRQFYSCIALLYQSPLLQYKYTKFYGKNHHHTWSNADGTELTRDQRIIMLLTFAEIG